MPDHEDAPRAGGRIAKVMARAGLCSRREAEDWIAAGRVAVNGARLASAAFNVSPQDRITVDGVPLPLRERTRLFRYHKPRGLVTTARDPQGRLTVFEKLPAELPRVVSIGRLDLNSEGLLLLTNDGGLKRVLELPETGWLRRYRVRAHGKADPARLERLRQGVTVDGVAFGPVEVSIDRARGANVWLTVGLREGKYREVRRVLESTGLKVNRLIRISYGPFPLGELAPGAVAEVPTRHLREQLGARLARAAGCDFEAPVRQRLADVRRSSVARSSPSPARASPSSSSSPREDRRGREKSKRGEPERARHGRLPKRRG
jgi:23S rRNA pseudouridine2605 synthase